MDTQPEKRLKISERECPHCDQVLSFKTYQAHKRIFYNAMTGDWIKKGNNIHDSASDDDNGSTDTDSVPPSETEMEQYPTIESPPYVDGAISYNSDSLNPDGIYMLYVHVTHYMHA